MPRGIPNKKRVVQTSGPAPTRQRAMAPINKEALLEKFKDYAAIDVITRRFLDPNDPGSMPILLHDEDTHACVDTHHQFRLKENATRCQFCQKPLRKWTVRWVNTSIEGRWGQIRAKGYVPVEVKELKDEQDVADLVRRTEEDSSVYVRRGDRGQEVLCKMPMELYQYLKRSQRETQRTRNNSKRQQVAELAEAAGSELGDEAGQMIHDGGIRVEMMKRTHTTVADEAAGGDDAIDG